MLRTSTLLNVLIKGELLVPRKQLKIKVDVSLIKVDISLIKVDVSLIKVDVSFHHQYIHNGTPNWYTLQ